MGQTFLYLIAGDQTHIDTDALKAAVTNPEDKKFKFVTQNKAGVSVTTSKN